MAKISFDITADNSQVLQSLQQTIEKISQLEHKTDDAAKKTASSSSAIGKGLSGMVMKYASLTAVVATFGKTLRSAIEVNKSFERKNSELASVLGTTKDGVTELSKAAEELGRTTEFTATEVTELQIALARLGFTRTQILDMEDSVLKFAAAVNAVLGSAAAFAGATLRGFGLEAKDTEHLLDVMAASTSKSALDFRKLEVSMSLCSAPCRTLVLKRLVRQWR